MMAGSAQPVLEAVDVVKSYGKVRALRGVSLSAQAGEVLGVIGPNGAGKTTLMTLIAGLTEPDHGSLTIGGMDLRRNQQRCRAQLGYAPQELGIYPSLSVHRNLTTMAELYGLPRRVAAERASEVGTALGLGGLLDRQASKLSGGEKRRLHAGMAMTHRPPLLLLDEPTAGVDTETRAQLLDYVTWLARVGTAVLYTSHYLPEVEQIADRVAVLGGGRVLAQGVADQVIARYSHGYVQLVFASEPASLPPLDQASIDGGTVTIPSDQPFDLAPRVLSQLGDRREQLTSVRVVPANLEDAYRNALASVTAPATTAGRVDVPAHGVRP